MPSGKVISAIATVAAIVAVAIPSQAGSDQQKHELVSAISGAVAAQTASADECHRSGSDEQSVSVDASVAAAFNNNADAIRAAQSLLFGDYGTNLNGLTFTPTMVAGILGNYAVESGITFDKLEHKDENSGGALDGTKQSNEFARSWGRRGAYGLGIAQWTWCKDAGGDGNRACALVDLAESMDKNWYEPDVQVQMMVNELSGGYRNSVYDVITQDSSASDVAWDWFRHYEGITKDNGTGDQRAATAGSLLPALETLKSTDGSKTGNMVTLTSGGGGDGSDSPSCAATVGNGTAGGVDGEAPSRDEAGGTFGWMCDAVGVCKDGDYGQDSPNLSAAWRNWASKKHDYQCYWYAFMRAAMVHGKTDKWMEISEAYPSYIKDGESDGVYGAKIHFSNEPKAGYLICNDGTTSTELANGGGHEHIAFIEKVNDDGSLVISEGNWNDGGNGLWTSYNKRTLKDKGDFAHYHFMYYDEWNE